jgi:hypothetical protein
MKVWVCTDGDYESMSVMAVYDDEALARRACSRVGWSCEEMELNSPDPRKWLPGNLYRVIISLYTKGAPYQSYVSILSCSDPARLALPEDADWNNDKTSWGVQFQRNMWLPSQERAMEIARDKFEQVKVERDEGWRRLSP